MLAIIEPRLGILFEFAVSTKTALIAVTRADPLTSDPGALVPTATSPDGTVVAQLGNRTKRGWEPIMDIRRLLQARAALGVERQPIV